MKDTTPSEVLPNQWRSCLSLVRYLLHWLSTIRDEYVANIHPSWRDSLYSWSWHTWTIDMILIHSLCTIEILKFTYLFTSTHETMIQCLSVFLMKQLTKNGNNNQLQYWCPHFVWTVGLMFRAVVQKQLWRTYNIQYHVVSQLKKHHLGGYRLHYEANCTLLMSRAVWCSANCNKLPAPMSLSSWQIHSSLTHSTWGERNKKSILILNISQ